MATVEELRMGLLLQVSMMKKHVELLDALIAAVREEEAAEDEDNGVERVAMTIAYEKGRAKGRIDGATEERARQEAAYRKGEY